MGKPMLQWWSGAFQEPDRSMSNDQEVIDPEEGSKEDETEVCEGMGPSRGDACSEHSAVVVEAESDNAALSMEDIQEEARSPRICREGEFFGRLCGSACAWR